MNTHMRWINLQRTVPINVLFIVNQSGTAVGEENPAIQDKTSALQ